MTKIKMKKKTRKRRRMMPMLKERTTKKFFLKPASNSLADQVESPRKTGFTLKPPWRRSRSMSVRLQRWIKKTKLRRERSFTARCLL